MSRRKRRYTEEEQTYLDVVDSQAARLDRLPEGAKRRLRAIRVRCPDGGCLLASVWELPLRGGGFRYLCEARHGPRSLSVGILNWHFHNRTYGCRCCEPALEDVESSCRHGDAVLGNAWLMDCLAVAFGWTGPSQTVEEMVAGAPEELQLGARSGVFHPAKSAWRSPPAQRCTKMVAN